MAGGVRLPGEPLRRETIRRETLRGETAARLAAHRARRGALPVAVDGPREVKRRSAVAEAVAERYAHSPSYRAYLAEEAEKATRRAAAAAEIALRNAQAVARVEAELKEELERWQTAAMGVPEAAVPEQETAGGFGPGSAMGREVVPELPTLELGGAGLTVRLYEGLGQARATARQAETACVADPAGWEEAMLEEEIAFRQAPVFAASVAEPEAIAGNLLEFPRHLVASRQARPVLALGPLRETAGASEGQLRIFEVEPQELSSAPAIATSEPGWSSIWLDAPAVSVSAEVDAPGERLVLHPASIGLRAMAATVDGLLIGCGYLAFAVVFGSLASAIQPGLPLALASLGLLVALTGLYGAIFFSFSDQTAGMRYARIGFCTFSDENPQRVAIRRRMSATLVALCPFGLGLLWALVDDDRLGWHDRMSRMYHRAY